MDTSDNSPGCRLGCLLSSLLSPHRRLSVIVLWPSAFGCPPLRDDQHHFMQKYNLTYSISWFLRIMSSPLTWFVKYLQRHITWLSRTLQKTMCMHTMIYPKPYSTRCSWIPHVYGYHILSDVYSKRCASLPRSMRSPTAHDVPFAMPGLKCRRLSHPSSTLVHGYNSLRAYHHLLRAYTSQLFNPTKEAPPAFSEIKSQTFVQAQQIFIARLA